MNCLAISVAAFVWSITSAVAADMPEMVPLNPQPLPPIEAEETLPSAEMTPLNPQPLPPIEAEANTPVEAPVEAVDARVEIINGTGVPLAELYSSSAGAENWQTNILTGGTVAPGASVTVNFANAASLCEFDLRAIFSDGTDQVIRALDACSVGALTFTG